METRSKSVAIRMVKSDVVVLDQLARESTFYSRSDIINAAVRLVIQPEFKPFIRDLLRFSPEYGEKVKKLELELGR